MPIRAYLSQRSRDCIRRAPIRICCRRVALAHLRPRQSRPQPLFPPAMAVFITSHVLLSVRGKQSQELRADAIGITAGHRSRREATSHPLCTRSLADAESHRQLCTSICLLATESFGSFASDKSCHYRESVRSLVLCPISTPSAGPFTGRRVSDLDVAAFRRK
jgi:hypothetical protein